MNLKLKRLTEIHRSTIFALVFALCTGFKIFGKQKYTNKLNFKNTKYISKTTTTSS